MTRGDARRWLVVLTLTRLALATPEAHAQSAEAEVLFREGRTLIKAGKLEAGCDKLEASEKLETSVGTLLNLGDCHEKLGRVASAWAAFRKAEAMAKQRGRDEKRRNEAAKRALALEPKLFHVVIVVTNEVSGLVVKRDDEVIESPMWSTPLPVDPETYTIVAEAPGYEPWRTQITVGGMRRRYVVTVPALDRTSTTPPPVQTAAPTTDLPPSPSPPAPAVADTRTANPPLAPPRIWTTSRKVAIGVAVAGLVAAGTGVYFGLRSRDDEAESNELCPGALCDVPEGLRLNDSAQTAARNANIFFALGGVALATSGIVWFVGGPDREVRITPSGSDRVDVSLGGRF
jgi:hypothetical protein